MPKKRRKPIPRFRDEAHEREFWSTHDTADYVDWSGAERAVFPNLHPSTESISLRLPAPLLADLKALANERDVPYQSLLKVFLAKQVREELAAPRPEPAPARRSKTPRRTRTGQRSD